MNRVEEEQLYFSFNRNRIYINREVFFFKTKESSFPSAVVFSSIDNMLTSFSPS